jgi:hypothetical protein
MSQKLTTGSHATYVFPEQLTCSEIYTTVAIRYANVPRALEKNSNPTVAMLMASLEQRVQGNGHI